MGWVVSVPRAVEQKSGGREAAAARRDMRLGVKRTSPVKGLFVIPRWLEPLAEGDTVFYIATGKAGNDADNASLASKISDGAKQRIQGLVAVLAVSEARSLGDLDDLAVID